MAKVGDVIENPVSGQRLIFRRAGQDSPGDLLEVESIYAKPSSSRLPVHYHPHQEERFEVLSGELQILIGAQEQTLRVGEIYFYRLLSRTEYRVRRPGPASTGKRARR